MKGHASLACYAFQRALLGGASLLVPAEQRRDWISEWRGELWHVRRFCTAKGQSGWRGEREITSFCIGAIQDAFCLRRQSRRFSTPFALLKESPAQCLLFLGALATAGLLISFVEPGVRTEREVEAYTAYSRLVLIRDANARSDKVASISPHEFHKWAEAKGKFFDAFAFYQVADRKVAAGRAAAAAWHIAFATSNLFTMLDVPIRFAKPEESAGDNLPRIVLSDRTWKKEFDGDPQVVGDIVRVGNREARIAGVAPKGSWRLPSKVDAWALIPEDAIAPQRSGYVIAHLTSAGKSRFWAARELITVHGPHHAEHDLIAISLDEPTPQPGETFLFAVLLALLALPALTSVSMGDRNLASHRPSRPAQLRRYGFFVAKIALVVAIAYFASLDLAYAWSSAFMPVSTYIHVASCFLICLAGASWACCDQRQRCPVCLMRVTHPARVGLASQSFLGWNGTELMCRGGHTLLHIPALPTSWFSNQRWIYLDRSWQSLFAG